MALCILRQGPVPKHIAIIMDGNRRWAREHNMERSKGHSSGYDKLEQSLHWFEKLGVKQVTVYAFSIENFKRTSDEVENLMALAEKKFIDMLQKS